MDLAPFDIDTSPPSPELLEFSRKDLRETPQVREAAILELRKLLHNATDLHYRDDDDFLMIFLRPCHFYAESALKMVRFGGGGNNGWSGVYQSRRIKGFDKNCVLKCYKNQFVIGCFDL